MRRKVKLDLKSVAVGAVVATLVAGGKADGLGALVELVAALGGA